MFTWWAMWPMSCTIKDVATARRRQCPAEWWALRLILGVYSPLSIAAMPPVSLVGLSWAMDPDRRLAAALTHVPLNGPLGGRR
jgi:hypothetical protein